jgi:hypothetical protein
MSKAIDQRTEDAVETVLQQELLRNERIVQHPTFGAVRLRRPSPDQERSIANERRKQFHRDMQDESILSRDQLERLATQRGMWSPDMREKIEDLSRKTGQAMGILEAIGFKNVETLIADYEQSRLGMIALVEENEETQAAMTRYFDLDGEALLTDRSLIANGAMSSEVDDLLDTADALRQQIKVLTEMAKVRRELSDLNLKQTKLFVDSLEARADRAEELARIYYCVAHATTGAPLWPSYDAMWQANADDITHLMDEMYFFLNGITDEFKNILGRYGFLQRLSDTDDSSDGSPVQPQSKTDGELQESSLNLSSEPTE